MIDIDRAAKQKDGVIVSSIIGRIQGKLASQSNTIISPILLHHWVYSTYQTLAGTKSIASADFLQVSHKKYVGKIFRYAYKMKVIFNPWDNVRDMFFG